MPGQAGGPAPLAHPQAVRHRFGQLLAGSGLLLVAVTTLIPLPHQAAASQRTPLWCLVCGDQGAVDVLHNLLLFIPLGAGLTLLGVKARAVVLSGILISLAVEALQYLVIPGRDPSLSDLLTNTLGSWFGTLVGKHYRHLLWPRSGAARLLALGGALVWWMVQTGTAAVLRPWAPPGELRAAGLRPNPGQATPNGLVTSAFVSGVAVPRDSGLVRTDVAARIREGLVSLDLEISAGRTWPRGSPIFHLVARSGGVLSVEGRGRDVLVHWPARARAWRLRPPALRLVGAAQERAGTSLQLAAGERGDTLWARWTSDSRQLRAEQVLSPSLGWSLLVPFHYAYGKEVPWVTALWIAGWMVAVGYWSRSARMGSCRWPWLLLVLLVGLGFVPHLMGYPVVAWSEWLAGAIGLMVGWAGGRDAT